MKIFQVLAIASIASLGATAGFAQSAFDGSIGVEYTYAPKDGFNYQAQLNGSLVYSLSPKISFQLDMGDTYYQGQANGIIDYGLHAIYSPSDKLDFGVFYSSTNRNVQNAGLEVNYTAGKLDFEVAAGAYDLNFSRNYIVGIQAGYSFDSAGSMRDGINVYGGTALLLNSNASVAIPNYYIGAKVNIRNNLDVNIRAASADRGTLTYYTIGLEYSFGKGSVFTARDFSAFMPGY